MSYTPGEPVATRSLATSQPIIKDNFTLSNQYFGLEHYAFNDPSALKGLHKYCTLTNQAVAPVTNATQGALYCKLLAARSELYFRRESNGTEVQMTANADPTWVVAGATGKGKTFLPGNLLYQFGYLSVPAATTVTVVLPQAFSGGFAAYSIQVSMERASGSAQQVVVDEGSVTDAQFGVWHTASGAHVVYWTAIGPA